MIGVEYLCLMTLKLQIAQGRHPDSRVRVAVKLRRQEKFASNRNIENAVRPGAFRVILD